VNEHTPINQLFTSAQHLLLLIIGLHVSIDYSVIFSSLICCKFQGALHTFGMKTGWRNPTRRNSMQIF